MTRSIDTTQQLRDGVHIQLAPSGALQVWWSGRAHALHGIPADLARAVVARLERAATVAELHAACAEWPADAVDAVLAALDATGCVERGSTAAVPNARVVVLSNGALGDRLEARLARAGLTVEKVRVGSFRSVTRPPTSSPSVLRRAPGAPPPAEGLAGVDAATLAETFARADVAVCALEGVSYAALLEVNAAASRGRTPCLFAGVKDATWAFIGPAVSRVASPCLECVELRTYGPVVASRAELLDVHVGTLDADDAVRSDVLCDRALDEVLALVGGPSTSDMTSSQRHVIDRKGGVVTRAFLSDGRCATCRAKEDAAKAPATRVELEMLAAAASAIGWDWPARPTAHVPSGSRPYRKVAIVGGGSAGYLTALALRAMRPELEISLIESSKIPIIGVGEATTPELVKFLHSPRFLNRRVDDLYRRVRPTWKLGIKFEWGLPAPYYFTFPFQRGRLLESIVYEDKLEDQSLGSMLMAADRAPVFRAEDGSVSSLVHLIRWAYHLDNESFVRWLTEEARASGIHHVDAEVTEVRVGADGETVEALVLDGKDVRSFDLYVDCSGFRSELLGKALKTPFQSWAGTLFTDRAIFAAVPNHGVVRPYTLAETMEAGWCWRIPFEHEDHRGYVFSSSFLDDDAALAEMRAKNPGMGDARRVSFRSGRHAECWRGNVLAIGNSYAFVEPLESTALHMIVQELELVAIHWPASMDDRGVKEMINRRLGDQWDRLRWFLGCHYRFNKRIDNKFWRAARAESDISGAAARIALFQERAPLSYRLPLSYKGDPPDFFADDHSFDTILLGQRAEASLVAPVADRETWRMQRRPLADLARGALTQQEAIRWLIDERPDVLEDFRKRPDSWLHSWLPA